MDTRIYIIKYWTIVFSIENCQIWVRSNACSGIKDIRNCFSTANIGIAGSVQIILRWTGAGMLDIPEIFLGCGFPKIFK